MEFKDSITEIDLINRTVKGRGLAKDFCKGGKYNENYRS